MSATLVHPVPLERPRPVAPLRHTLILIALFVVMAVWGAIVQHQAAPSGTLPRPHSALGLYLGIMAMEWGLVFYVWKAGLRPAGVSIRELIGGRWSSARDVAIDLATGFAAWGVWTLVALAWQRMSGPNHAASVDSLLPKGPIEVVAWIALSMTAGFTEELVFRGYFQRQFHAFTGSRSVALVAQAALFGVAHGYQGVAACAGIAAYGLLMGVISLGRRSLRSTMIAHAWTDIAAGLLRI